MVQQGVETAAVHETKRSSPHRQVARPGHHEPSPIGRNCQRPGPRVAIRLLENILRLYRLRAVVDRRGREEPTKRGNNNNNNNNNNNEKRGTRLT